MTAEATRRVGVIVNNVGGYSRAVIRGVASFATSRGWECRAQGVNIYDLPAAASVRGLDGLIVQADAAGLRRVRRVTDAAGLPVVNVSSAIEAGGTPSVVTDDEAVGRLGAEHFLRRGHRRLAFFGPDPRQFTLLRRRGFEQRAAEDEVSVEVLDDAAALADLLATVDPAAGVGVMACNDRAGLAALDAARAAGRRVPDEVAVLGVDNDDLMQSLASPALSTINTARERIGFEAAALLADLMDAAAPPPAPILVPPRGVIARKSTDVLAIPDDDVRAALRFIRTSAGRPIDVPAIAAATALSRRQLERRFQQHVGRTILAELRRERLDRARRLLAETDLTIAQIADASGFASATYFSTVFAEAEGRPPTAFRRGA